MASLSDVDRVADDLETLVGEMRSELKRGPDFGKLMRIADEISEHADNAAETFNSMNETLMARLEEIRGGKKSSGSSSGQSRERATTSSGSGSSSSS
jgi:hypothetical protein